MRVIPEIGDARFVEQLRYVGIAIENVERLQSTPSQEGPSGQQMVT
ncbi:MAG: hypothetical protein M3Y69_08660 [Verrucomicrobiota bacterium]|nr:hypothetical protein [Verrucomicrobiota bacterium]